MADTETGMLSQAAETMPDTPGKAQPTDTVSPDDGPQQQQQEEPYSVFSAASRTHLTYFLGFAMILSTLTATIYFPLIPLLSGELGVSVQAINLTVTVYAVAQALSPALFASLADGLGRRPVLLLLMAVYAAASLGLGLVGCTSYPALVALRALQSIGGSPVPSIAYGVVADVSPVAERGRMLGPMLSTCNGISAVGPVIGGAVALGTGGVQWVFFALLIIAVMCLLSAGFTLPETARCIVDNGRVPAVGVWRTWWSVFQGGREKARIARLGLLGRRNTDIPGVAVGLEPPERGRRQAWRVANAFAAFRIVLYKDAAAVLWMVASSYSVYYTFQVAIPVIFAEVYGYNELQIGFAFLPGLAGMTIGSIIAGKLVDRNYATTARRHKLEHPPREKREEKSGEGDLDFPIEVARYRNCLVFVLAESLLVIGYGWTVHLRVHPAVPIVLQFFVCGSSTLLSHTASALLVDIFPGTSSTAYASGQIARCGLSAVSAAVIQPLVDAVGYGWYFTMFTLFVGLTGVCSVVVSRLRGMKWRRRRHLRERARGRG